MKISLKKDLQKIANTIRGLSIDAIEKVRSGHPGLPLGCAEIGAYLFGYFLNFYPKDPKWDNRDRFILSAGHGSIFLYSCLHLSHFNISMKDLKSFRKLHSNTPGHPEYNIERGIEATTGPLGQGFGNSVGIALAYKVLANKFNTKEENTIFTNKIVCLSGDGCMMEGITAEASSLAGHLNLNNLIVIYDANNTCVEGLVSEICSENVKDKYKAYGWDVYEVDAYDFDSMDNVFQKLRKKQNKPALILAKTIIGKGSANKENTHKVHGYPLGPEEIKETKIKLKIPLKDFYIPEDVKTFFKKRLLMQKKGYVLWNKKLSRLQKNHKKLFYEYLIMKKNNRFEEKQLQEIEKELKNIEVKKPVSSKEVSGIALNYLARKFPFIYSGSADLSRADKTFLEDFKTLSPPDFKGRNIKYGIREFAMGAISNGLSLSGMVLPVCGTFLVFSDYMRNAIRVAALSKLKVIYHFSHDSFFIGEDGPTHQPIEHLASLRAIPDLQVIRPGSSCEVNMAWIAALKYNGPTCFILSKQLLPYIKNTDVSYAQGMKRGAYIVKKEKNKNFDFIFFATGSELFLTLKIAEELEKMKKDVRVVSIPSFDIFEQQSEKYKEKILAKNVKKRVSMEAGSQLGFHKYIGIDGIAISIDSFGLSGSPEDLKKEFGFTKQAILKKIL